MDRISSVPHYPRCRRETCQFQYVCSFLLPGKENLFSRIDSKQAASNYAAGLKMARSVLSIFLSLHPSGSSLFSEHVLLYPLDVLRRQIQVNRSSASAEDFSSDRSLQVNNEAMKYHLSPVSVFPVLFKISSQVRILSLSLTRSDETVSGSLIPVERRVDVVGLQWSGGGDGQFPSRFHPGEKVTEERIPPPCFSSSLGANPIEPNRSVESFATSSFARLFSFLSALVVQAKICFV